MTEAGIADDAQKKQLEALFGNEKVKAKLEGVLTEATEGILRERGRVTAATKEVEAEKAKSVAYYQSTLAKVNEANTAIQAAEARVAKYAELYGELPGGGDPNNPAAVARAVNADVIDKKTFTDRMTQTENNTIGLAKSVMKITAKHLREFPELDLDPDAITKIAVEQNLTAEKAWEEYTKPAREAKEKKRVEEQTAAAVEAARVDERTKRGQTELVDASPVSEFRQNWGKQSPTKTAEEAFVAGWNDPNAKGTMDKEFGPR